MKHRIGIIGAGIAGLSAARELVSTDRTVKLYDKGRGPGGRVSTRRNEEFVFDHGAQYFTVSDPRFKSVVDELERAGSVCRWEPRIKTFGDPGSNSHTCAERWVGIPGMSALGNGLAAGLDVETECTVTQIQKNKGLWFVWSNDRLLGEFDALILTLPVNQARPLAGDFLPPHWDLNRVRMDPCWAVMAGFSGSLDAGFDAAFVKGSPISWICDNASKPGQNGVGGWTIHSTGAWALDHLEDSREAVGEQLLRAFFEVTGLDPVEPDLVRAHRWRYAKPSPSLPEGYLLAEESALGLAGDWCQGATIEGAWLSGMELGQKIRDSFFGKPDLA